MVAYITKFTVCEDFAVMNFKYDEYWEEILFVYMALKKYCQGKEVLSRK